MSNKLYYFTIDLVVEEYELNSPIKISEKILEDFDEEISPKQVAEYLRIEPPIKENTVTMKEIFG